MTRLSKRFAVLLLAGSAVTLPLRAAAPGEGDDVEVIRLKVGSEVVGVVTPDGFDEAHGVRVRRIDDDSILDIGFDQMLPEDARRIRATHGYMPDDPDPILVDAMKIRFLDGSEMVGVILEQDSETIKFKHGAGAPTVLKRSGVRSVDPVKVDALEVYDPEELYGRELAARNPTTALDHYNVALYCESLQLWGRAKEHVARAIELDASFKADILAQKQKQYERRLEAGEDSELIAKSLRMARNDQYDAALAKLDEFLKAKPGSALRSDAEKARVRITKSREHWLGEQTIVHFFTNVDHAIRKVVAEPKASAKECRKQIEVETTKAAIEATAKFLKVAPVEVQHVWEDAKRQTASPHFGSYGSGTWTLGLEAAMKGITPEDPNKKADATSKPSKDETLEDRIKKLLEEKKKAQEEAQKKGNKKGGAPQQPNKKMASGPQVADVAPTEEEWWAGLTLDEKTSYLTGWWAEHEPNAKVYRYDQLPCATCSGLGSLRYVNPDGQEMAKPCPRCKGLEFDRVVRFH
jgi:tetratricopeptide (TPR) repeat protein